MAPSAAALSGAVFRLVLKSGGRIYSGSESNSDTVSAFVSVPAPGVISEYGFAFSAAAETVSASGSFSAAVNSAGTGVPAADGFIRVSG